jgi:hypothetical protein
MSDLEVLQSILILESIVQFFKDLRIVVGQNLDDFDHHHVKLMYTVKKSGIQLCPQFSSEESIVVIMSPIYH